MQHATSDKRSRAHRARSSHAAMAHLIRACNGRSYPNTKALGWTRHRQAQQTRLRVVLLVLDAMLRNQLTIRIKNDETGRRRPCIGRQRTACHTSHGVHFVSCVAFFSRRTRDCKTWPICIVHARNRPGFRAAACSVARACLRCDRAPLCTEATGSMSKCSRVWIRLTLVKSAHKRHGVCHRTQRLTQMNARAELGPQRRRRARRW